MAAWAATTADQTRDAINARAAADQAQRAAADKQNMAAWAATTANQTRDAINARALADQAQRAAANKQNMAAWAATTANQTRDAINARAAADQAQRSAQETQNAAAWAKANAAFSRDAINARATAEQNQRAAEQAQNNAAWAATTANQTRTAINARAAAQQSQQQAQGQQNMQAWAAANASFARQVSSSSVTTGNAQKAPTRVAATATTQATTTQSAKAWVIPSGPKVPPKTSTMASSPSQAGELSLGGCLTNAACLGTAAADVPSQSVRAVVGTGVGTAEGVASAWKGGVALASDGINAAAHPIQTGNEIEAALSHPTQTATAASYAVSQAVTNGVASAQTTATNFVTSTDAGYGGRVVGQTVGTAIVLDGAGKALGAASNLGTAAKTASVVDAARAAPLFTKTGLTVQMSARGWTEDEVTEMMQGKPTGISIDQRSSQSTPDGVARNDPATVYGTPSKYVIINDITNEVVQVSDKGDPNWVPDKRIVWK